MNHENDQLGPQKTPAQPRHCVLSIPARINLLFVLVDTGILYENLGKTQLSSRISKKPVSKTRLVLITLGKT